MKKAFFLISLVAALLSGCSSIISDTSYPVTINSAPASADFVIENKAGQVVHSGMTPATVTLNSSAGYFKKEAYTITLKKAGYADKRYTLTSTLDGWYFGNILFGGLIGMLIVDPLTGAMYNLPERVDVSLHKKAVESQSPATKEAPAENMEIKEDSAKGLMIKSLYELSMADVQRLEKLN